MASFALPASTTPPLAFSNKPIKPKDSIHLPQIHVSKSINKLGDPRILGSSYLHRISSFCNQGLIQEAFTLLNKMELSNLPIGPEVYVELLQGCIFERTLAQGQQVHARILKKNGAFFYKNEYMQTKLLVFYAKCDCSAVAEELFAWQHRANVFSWAAIIGLRSRLGFNEKALLGFGEMMACGLLPDDYVIPIALKACLALRMVGFAKGIHIYALKMGFDQCVYVLTSLVDFYGKCGALEDARRIFEEMPVRNVVTWNLMLVGYVQNAMNEKAVELFYNMRIARVQLT